MHKLTEAQVHEVRGRLAAGEQHASIAASYGVSRTAITHIASGKNWGWMADNDNHPEEQTQTAKAGGGRA